MISPSTGNGWKTALLRRLRRPAVLLFVTASMLRIGLATLAFPEPERAFLHGDSHTYDRQAMLLRDHGRYSSLGRPPLYPATLAVVYGIFGHSPITAILLQGLLDAATAVLIVRLAALVGLASFAALAAGWLYAFHPLAVLLSVHLVSEALFGFLLVSSLLLWIRVLREGRVRTSLLCGVLFGLALICRAILTPLLPLYFASVLASRHLAWKSRLRSLSLLVAGFLISAGPALAYFGLRYGIWLSTIGDLTFFTTNAPGTRELANGMSPVEFVTRGDPWQPSQREIWLEVRAKYGWKEAESYLLMDDPVRCKILGREARALLLREWPYTILAHLLGIFRCLHPFGMQEHLRSFTGGGTSLDLLSPLFLAAHFLFLVLLPLGGLRSVRAESSPGRKWILWILGLTALYLLAVTGPGGQSRYLVPVLPILCLLGGRAVSRIRNAVSPMSATTPPDTA